jgi:hypothetical protein
MATRDWKETVHLGKGGLDWDLLARTVLFVSRRVPEPEYVNYQAELRDSSVRATSFQDLRDELEPIADQVERIVMAVNSPQLNVLGLSTYE